MVFFRSIARARMSESRSSNNFKCPKCNAAAGSEVKDSRAPLEGNYIRRRRKCNACGHRFSTREMVWDDTVEESPKLKPQDVLNLRALAMNILNKTTLLSVPVEQVARQGDSSGR